MSDFESGDQGALDAIDAADSAVEAEPSNQATEGEMPNPDAAPQTKDERLEAVTRERDEYYDRLLRKSAEFDNYRKRVDRERRELTESAASDLIQEILLLVDDFDRALQVDAATQPDAYQRGVELIHKQLLDLLRKRGVTPIETLGTDFDPNIHQAVAHDESPGHRDGEVIEEFRRGYKLRDRLLRPAMVKVAKA